MTSGDDVLRPDADALGGLPDPAADEITGAELARAGNDAGPDADEARVEGPRIEPRQLVLGAITAVIVGAILVASIGRFAGYTDLGDTLAAAQWQWLVLCAVGQMAVFAGYAGAFRHAVAFEGGPGVAAGRSVQVVMASFAMTQLVAAGGAAGLAFTYWALRTIGFERRPALLRLIGLNTAVYLVFAGVGWAGAAVALFDDDVPAGAVVPWLVAVPVILVAAEWFTSADRVDPWTAPGQRGIRSGLAIGVGAAAWVRRTGRDESGRLVLAWALLYWVGDLLSLLAALRAFGASPGIAPLVVAYCTGYLAQMVPIPLIATGGVDAATTFTLTMVGVPVEVALLAVVAHRIFAFWLPIGPGLWSAVAITRQARAGERLTAT